jgi:threonine synthase
MNFVSTRDINGRKVSFFDAVFQGLAPDGGLYQPVDEPDLRALVRSLGADASFLDVAGAMIQGLFGEEYDAAGARDLAVRAFPFEPRLQPLEGGIEILELFHGPSCAFKDFGAGFLAATMETVIQRRGGRAVVLTATSGDTGSAVAQAFHQREHIDVVILYPSGRVSPLQERQLTTLGGNVHALEVRGSFDDCQRMVKEAFQNRSIAATIPLTSANSINVGRLIPQSLYYLWAFAQRKEAMEDELFFCVPSGNFGNLTAGIMAWRWGMAVKGFIAATNANDVVPEYLHTGIFTPRESIQTLANAMDVGNPSNFERLQHIFAGVDPTTILTGGAVSDTQIRATMKDVYERHGMLVCPHTATGIHLAREVRAGGGTAGTDSGDERIITLATAHPAKFLEVIEDAVGVEAEVPERLARLMNVPKVSHLVDPTVDALGEFLRALQDTW